MLKTQAAMTITEHTFQGTVSTVFISRLVYTMRQEYQSSKQKEKKKYLISMAAVLTFFCLSGLGFCLVCLFGDFVCLVLGFVFLFLGFVCLPQLICSWKVTYLKKKK